MTSPDESIPWAYLNGGWVPAHAASVPVWDAGFVLGTTVSEQLRTFGGRLFRWEAHWSRFERSLATVGIEPSEAADDVSTAAARLVAHNLRLLPEGAELGLGLFATPGSFAAMAPEAASAPTLGLHTWRLPVERWSEKYHAGEHLVVTPVRQVPADCWPRHIKCRSRMHYYLADRAAHQQQAGARALLLDQAGQVCETASANVVAYRASEGLVSPPRGQILPGITLEVLFELAAALGMACVERPLMLDDLLTADEVMLTSTPSGLLPVTRIDERAIGSGVPGSVYQALLAAFSRLVGIDLAAVGKAG